MSVGRQCQWSKFVCRHVLFSSSNLRKISLNSYLLLDTSIILMLPSVGIQYQHRWVISSPPFTRATPACLNIVFTSLTYFGVHLRCIDMNATFSDRLLYRTRGLLEDSSLVNNSTVHSNLFLNINISFTCSVAFEVRTSSPGTLAAIERVSLLDGQCSSTKGLNTTCWKY